MTRELTTMRALRVAATLLGAAALVSLGACGDSGESLGCDPEIDSCSCTLDETGQTITDCFGGTDSFGRSCSCGFDGFDPDPFPQEPEPEFNGEPEGQPEGEPEFVPEVEERLNFQAPQPSRNYVFVANTGLDTVARIDGDTLAITSIEVGDAPTVVRAWKETNVAVVLNSGSDDVSIIHARPASNDVVTLPIREGFNQLVIAPGGAHALVYLDYKNAEPDSDIGRFQDVNLIRLTEGEEAVFNVAVGFRVTEIEFDDEGERAFVVTEDGISVIEMAGVDRDINAQPIKVTEDPLEDAEAVDREVEITGDGRLAVVRSSVLQGVNLVPLDRRGGLVQVSLPGVPTDLDIYPDSSRAVAVLKDARQVALLDLGAAVDDPEALTLIDVPEGPMGLAALDTAAGVALLYSTVSAEPRITRLDLETGAQVVWDVRKAISGVNLSPDASRAVVFHVKGDAPRTSAEADVFIANSFAYTVLDVASGFAKLTTAATEPGEFVFGPDGLTMFVVLNDKASGVRQVDRINLESFRVDAISLGSPPEHIGLLPSSSGAPRIYVSQEHPVGRMTFIDVDDGEAKTVTGYELNSRVD